MTKEQEIHLLVIYNCSNLESTINVYLLFLYRSFNYLSCLQVRKLHLLLFSIHNESCVGLAMLSIFEKKRKLSSYFF